jgi:hypothetical protein
MRCPAECYQVQEALAVYLPQLRPAQRRGLTLWVSGTILAHSSCQNAVISALFWLGRWHTVRQYLREWLYDGGDRAAPCQTEVTVTTCFAPLLRWILSWWQSEQLALALDATYHGTEHVALVVSVLYRGAAIPVAWAILPANQPGPWLPHELRLLRLLWPAVPPRVTVLVLTDRGLWSPRLWRRITRLGWHPLMRLRLETTFTPRGQSRVPARDLVDGPGQAWIGSGVAYKPGKRQAGTLLVVWDLEQAEPWILLTDLPPKRVGAIWYGLRIWIELGFRALKGVGWRWEHTRRRDRTRVARHWLVLAVATLWVLAYGTRAEDAAALDRDPAYLHQPPTVAIPPRTVSLFRRGLTLLTWLLPRRRCWRRLWLRPEPWPTPAPHLQVHVRAGP